MANAEPTPGPQAGAALARAPLFDGLDPPILAALAGIALRRDYAERQVVLLIGDVDDGLYVVGAGWLKAVKTAASGREQTVATFGPGMVFNNIAALAGAPAQASVIALEPATLWRIPRAGLLALSNAHPTLSHVLIQSLAARVMHLASLVEDLALRPVDARLARLLLSQAVDGQVQRRRWATQSELAAQLGTVPDVLNRALRSLADDGLIVVERRRIRIIDLAGLEARAQID